MVWNQTSTVQSSRVLQCHCGPAASTSPFVLRLPGSWRGPSRGPPTAGTIRIVALARHAWCARPLLAARVAALNAPELASPVAQLASPTVVPRTCNRPCDLGPLTTALLCSRPQRSPLHHLLTRHSQVTISGPIWDISQLPSPDELGIGGIVPGGLVISEDGLDQDPFRPGDPPPPSPLPPPSLPVITGCTADATDVVTGTGKHRHPFPFPFSFPFPQNLRRIG